jgi:hypothetical protein
MSVRANMTWNKEVFMQTLQSKVLKINNTKSSSTSPQMQEIIS